MSAMSKRDRQIAALSKLFGQVKAKGEVATQAQITVWKEKLSEIWSSLTRFHDEVMERAGDSEITEHNNTFDMASDAYDEVKLLLEELNQIRRDPVVKTCPDVQKDELEKLRLRHLALTRRLESTCARVPVDGAGIQPAILDTLKCSIEKIHESLQEIVLDLVANGADQDELMDAEALSDQVYETAMQSINTARGPIVALEGPPEAPPAAPGANALKMPHFQIAPFDGRFEKWEAFRESFTQGIDLRTNLPAVQKLQYLKSVLRGEPEELIQNFALTNDNYRPAWQLLNDRYNNVRDLVTSHLDVLTSFPMCKQSADDLRRMSNKTSSSLQALSNLNRPIEQWNDWVVYHVCKKLDPESRRMWEQQQALNEELPMWKDLDLFLQTRIRALSAVGNIAPTSSQSVPPKQKVRTHQTTTSTAKYVATSSGSDTKYSCPCCSDSHIITFCPEFRRMSPTDRRLMVANKSLCFVCLKSGHQAVLCHSTRNCHKCNQRHNSMLHLSPEPAAVEQRETEQVCVNLVGTRSHILLATAIVNVCDDHGNHHKLRALLDQGSEASFISENAAQKLRLRRQAEKIDIVGLSGSTAGTSRQSVIVNVSDCHGQGFNVDVHAFIIARVTCQIGRMSVDTKYHNWPHLSGITLADPDCMQSQTVDLLLGSDVYGMLLLPGLRQCAELPTAQNTVLGWILSGSVPNQSGAITSAISTHHAQIDDQLARFWELEEPKLVRRYTPADEQCESFYAATVHRDDAGRIHVRLPMKQSDIRFGESQRFAVQRQLQIERRFMTNPTFANQYREFMEQYEALGHMEEVPCAFVDMTRSRATLPASGREYYIPHHAVIKEASSTTKLRVVFDASRRTTSGHSLNEMMHIGPRLQENLTAIMLRWRKFRIAFSADIQKMYRQIVVDAPDTDLQRIVWRSTADAPMKVYRLCTVTYGTAAAPYLAIKSLETLAHLERDRYPLGSHVVLNHFYVDDVLCGADSVKECIATQSELKLLLDSGGFSLRKWASNEDAVLSEIPIEHQERKVNRDIMDDASISALGVQWDPSADTISFKIDIPAIGNSITKRAFLSAASRLYDPLGWLTPSIIVVKLMFQSLWKESIGWDDELPKTLADRWIEVRAGLIELKQLRIHRWIGTTSESIIEVHGFCDASMAAYAAVIFVRIVDPNQPPKVFNICAKSKVAPIKVVSLPRLELCGAVLLVKLLDDVLQAMQWPNASVHCWTDSTIVLAWLQGSPAKYNTFVANRTSEIQAKFPSGHWRHVKSEDNPADCASRGISPQQLLTHPLWWTGPHWLRDTVCTWPRPEPVSETVEETRVRSNHAVVPAASWDLLARFGSWRKLVRVTAWCLRFAHNIRASDKSSRKYDWLTPSELTDARTFWVRYSQATEFKDELRCLKRTGSIGKSSALRSLNPFVSTDGTLLVGGRLVNAIGIEKSSRYPAIIPRRSELSALLVADAHEQTLHGGPGLMMAYLRRAYWIIDGPNEARRYVQRCTVCFRFACKPSNQIMSALPSARVVASRPFRHCAMDYSGAIMVRSSKGRGHHATKAYVSVFICLATKAAHIELVSDLTTSAFIAAYERFISRRGSCTDLYSDNATNYVGAASVFQRSERKQFDEHVRAALASKGTTWHFSPPLSPHFNGLAESAIRSVKYHIRRVIGETRLTFEEMTTVLAKIEACLNSRPLCPINSDPTNFDALTPGHFLIGEPIKTIPQPDVTDANPSTLTRWQLTQQLVQHFWRRWSREYLHTLQQRRKWQSSSDNMQIGDMVLVIEDNLPPAQWAIGRVCDVHPGSDGIVRVISITTKGSTYKRSIVKVARLPIDV